MVFALLEKIRQWFIQLWNNNDNDDDKIDDQSETSTPSLTGEESIDVQIRPKIDGSFCYLEFDSQGQLNLNDQPSVSMCRFEAGQPHVFKFSDLTRNIFLTGQVVGINIVRGQDSSNVSDGRDLWLVRRDSNLKHNEVLIQFYGTNFQNKKFDEFGLFFVVQGNPPEFKLDSYFEAMKDGVFLIDTSS